MSDSGPRFLEPGSHTARGGTLAYRLGMIRELGILTGDWLDIGCAEGYYTEALPSFGARTATGVEPLSQRIDEANARVHDPLVSFVVGQSEQLPFPEESFDGVLLNEVLEHVSDERRTLREATRVLRPGGELALLSPNRWFPFEGHGARWSESRVLMDVPVPLLPWLPARIAGRVMTARNYWPGELATSATAAGLLVTERRWVLIQFDRYRWAPPAVMRWYREHLDEVARSPAARFLAVSTLIVARKPGA